MGRKRENPEKNHLTHPQAELGLSHMWPERGSNPHQTQRWDDRMVKCDNEISALLTTRPRGPPRPRAPAWVSDKLLNITQNTIKIKLMDRKLNNYPYYKFNVIHINHVNGLKFVIYLANFSNVETYPGWIDRWSVYIYTIVLLALVFTPRSSSMINLRE